MDQLTYMATFVKVVERGGFAAAARELDVAPSIVTAHVQALEKRLGARLLNRTTRRVNLTEAGEAYYARCMDLLKRVEEADEFVGTIQNVPRGILRLNASLLLPSVITPVISRYTAAYPEVSVRLIVTGRMVDLVEEQYDLAIRHKRPSNPGLIVRTLAEFRFLVCGSPRYFETRPKPGRPSDLVHHNCLLYTDSEAGERWPIFNTDDDALVKGTFQSNNLMALVQAAEDGQGLTVAPDFIVADALRQGRLVSVLDEFATARFPITIVYPHRDFLPVKVRLFADMLNDALKATRRDAPPVPSQR